MARALIPALLLCLLFVVSCAPAPEQKQEVVVPEAAVSASEQASASEQISGSWNWVVKAGEANRELWNDVKAGYVSEAGMQMNAIPVYLDEAEKIINSAPDTTIAEEKCTIDAIRQYIAYFRTGLALNEKMLALVSESSKLGSTTDLADMNTATTAAQNAVAGAKTELARAKSQINAIDLGCASSDVRVFITVDKNQVADSERMLEDMGNYLSALKNFIECGQTFEKVVPAVEKKNFDGAISLVKKSRELAAKSKEGFSRLTGSTFTEIAADAVMFKNKAGIFDDGLAKFEEALVALRSGRTGTAEKLLDEANAKFQSMQ